MVITMSVMIMRWLLGAASVEVAMVQCGPQGENRVAMTRNSGLEGQSRQREKDKSKHGSSVIDNNRFWTTGAR